MGGHYAVVRVYLYRVLKPVRVTVFYHMSGFEGVLMGR